MKNPHYQRADKLTRKLKKQKHPQKMHVNMIIDEITEGMKETLPKYKRVYRPDGTYFLINLHDMLA